MLEWAWHVAYYYPDNDLLDYQALNAVNENQQGAIVFHLPGSANLLYSPYPIAELWQAANDKRLEDDSLELPSTDNHLLIWRRENDILIEHLNETEWDVLVAIHRGTTFEKLCEAFTHTILKPIVQRGWIGGFELP